MELNELKELVRRGEVGAISLDTSIFESQGLKLESGLLKQLEQFLDRPTKLIISEVVKEEVLLHITEKAQTAQREINKALKDAKNYWQVEDSDIEEIQKSLFGGREAQKVASERFSQFIEATSLEIIEAKDYLIVSELIQKYFRSQPPFAEKGNKKQEFPDAIALISLETWANKNKTKIIVVTLDNDWKNFCKGSETLYYSDDFAWVLALFQNADDLCRDLSKKYENGALENVKQAVLDALNYNIYEMDIYPAANSSFNYEQEVTQINVTGFEFELLESPNIIFRPVNFDDNSLIVESKLSVDVNVECSFSFYVGGYIDKDYVKIGGYSVNTQANLEVEVLITFSGDFKSVGAQVKVDEVEVEMKTPASIDFGEIEPYWRDEDYDY
ncbi:MULTISPECIES: PIN domain-containing protein [unclassified Microcoleus]|uniref:PIN domain-containing protein n=1 Tax=unclassified Microcoleus TaxID=2642155 RepID=UPI002FD121E7